MSISYSGSFCILPKVEDTIKWNLQQVQNQLSFTVEDDERDDPAVSDTEEVPVTSISFRNWNPLGVKWTPQKFQNMVNYICMNQKVDNIIQFSTWQSEWAYDFGMITIQKNYSRTNKWDVTVQPNIQHVVSNGTVPWMTFNDTRVFKEAPEMICILHGQGNAAFVVVENMTKAIMPYDILPSVRLLDSPDGNVHSADQQGLFPVAIAEGTPRVVSTIPRNRFEVPSLLDTCCNVVSKHFGDPFSQSSIYLAIPDNLTKKLNKEGRICTGCGLAFFGKSAILIPFKGLNSEDGAWGRYCSVGCIPNVVRRKAAKTFGTLEFLQPIILDKPKHRITPTFWS